VTAKKEKVSMWTVFKQFFIPDPRWIEESEAEKIIERCARHSEELERRNKEFEKLIADVKRIADLSEAQQWAIRDSEQWLEIEAEIQRIISNKP
jgi:hypothetical protein